VHEAPHPGAAGIALTRSPLEIFVVVVCLALMASLATIMLSLYSRRRFSPQYRCGEKLGAADMNRLATLFISTLPVSVLNACGAAQKTTLNFYDECSSRSSFIAMAECGKQRRLAYCTQHSNCGAAGTAFMQYTDALALSVKNKEMSEAEAMRRFAEYKTTLLANEQRNAAIVQAGAAASGPTTCTNIGGTVICN